LPCLRSPAPPCNAARELFLAQGFGATTMAAVAGRAEVAPQTVYAAYGSKAGLPGGLVRAAVTRSEERDDLLERHWVKNVLDLPQARGPARRVRAPRHRSPRAHEPHLRVIRSADTSAEALSWLEAELRATRYRDQAKVMRAVVDGGTLASGLSVKGAAETVLSPRQPGAAPSPCRAAEQSTIAVRSVIRPLHMP
jgi:AcrR family transcriptional regulator